MQPFGHNKDGPKNTQNDNRVHAKIEVLKYNNKKDIGKNYSCAEVGRHDSTQHTSSVTVLRGHGALLSHSGRDRTRTPWRRSAKESAVGLLPSTVQLTLAKIACANKVADFIVPFMKKLASNMQLMYLVA